MIVFNETVVGTLYGSVVFAQNFIIIGGPIAITSAGGHCDSHISFNGSVTRPFLPMEPSSVMIITSSAAASISSLKIRRSLFLAPIITITLLPISLCA